MTTVCEFCGQSVITMADDPEEAREEAVRKCDCYGAIRERSIQKAYVTVEKLFGPSNDFEYAPVDTDTLNLIKGICVYVIDGTIGTAGIVLGDGQRVNIGRSRKGEIYVERKQTDVQKLTV